MTSFNIRIIRSVDELKAYKEHWIRLSLLDSREGFSVAGNGRLDGLTILGNQEVFMLLTRFYSLGKLSCCAKNYYFWNLKCMN